MSTMRSGGDDAARRSYLGVSRATIVSADDKPKMQELTIRGRFGEQFTNVESWGHYGVSYVPLPPDKDGEAEVLTAYLGGSQDHPVAIGVADRRHRLKDLKPGDVAHHDHRGQKTIYHKDGITKQSPMTITHNVVDKDGKTLSTIVQHKDGKKITMTNADGSTIEMDGKDIHHKPASGGKNVLHGDAHVKGSLSADKMISGLGGVLSGGRSVRTV